MGKSYKFKGEVNHSFNKKKRPLPTKERVEDNKVDRSKQNPESHDYSEWEEDGDYEKFSKSRR